MVSKFALISVKYHHFAAAAAPTASTGDMSALYPLN